MDVKGVAFEEFLSGTYRGGGLGQYFTPRDVVSFMVALADPSVGDRVIDPSCGSGGFLIRVYDVVSEKILGGDTTQRRKKEQLRELASHNLVGIDWEPRAARTCKMNMIIHGDGHAGVYQANALDHEEIDRKVEERRRFYPTAPDVQERAFNVVLTNPPFGAKDDVTRILKNYALGRGASQKREVLLLERQIRLLEPGGRLAVVIPEGVLSNKMDQRLRNYITDTCIVKAIIRLPQDAFKMSEGAACTSVLYALKKNPDDPVLAVQGGVFFARAEHIGVSPSGKQIDRNDLLTILEEYRRFEAGNWSGVEVHCDESGDGVVVNASRGNDGPWIEPTVNRTSLLYDRMAYVFRPHGGLRGRFSYTYHHPLYYQLLTDLANMDGVVSLESLCVEGFPIRGKKPTEEAADGISILKVRNVTGDGIDLDTEFAPDSEAIRASCTLLQQGDVLVTSTGEGTIGRVDVYRYDAPAVADGHVAICRFAAGVNRDYVVEFLRSEIGQIQILRHVSGSTGQTELLVDHVRTLQIPVPDYQTQSRIVESMGIARKEAGELREQAQTLNERGIVGLAEARRGMLEELRRSRPSALAVTRDPAGRSA